MSLAGIAPAVGLLGPAAVWAQAEGDVFLRTSRIVTGADALSADIALRIEALLADRIDGFASRLYDLVAAMQETGGGREEMLGALSDAQVEFALDVARPWYLGYVGTPSNTILQDDAVFATFLQAQSYDKILGEVPRPTYPGHNAGWWDVAPPGVDAPSMPDEILSWTFHPGGPSRILAPDPEWRSYASADHASIEDARLAKPAARGASDPG